MKKTLRCLTLGALLALTAILGGGCVCIPMDYPPYPGWYYPPHYYPPYPYHHYRCW